MREVTATSEMKKYLNLYALTPLLLAATVCMAEVGVSRDWIWSTEEEDFYYAITMNSEEHVLGQYCYLARAVCIYMVGFNITCELGETYPAMVNSDKGAAHVLLECSHRVDGQNILALNEFDKIDAIVREASRIGFVIPMANDKFKVARLSLMGSAAAIDNMRAAAKRAIGIREEPAKVRQPDEEFM